MRPVKKRVSMALLAVAVAVPMAGGVGATALAESTPPATAQAAETQVQAPESADGITSAAPGSVTALPNFGDVPADVSTTYFWNVKTGPFTLWRNGNKATVQPRTAHSYRKPLGHAKGWVGSKMHWGGDYNYLFECIRAGERVVKRYDRAVGYTCIPFFGWNLVWYAR